MVMLRACVMMVIAMMVIKRERERKTDRIHWRGITEVMLLPMMMLTKKTTTKELMLLVMVKVMKQL